nr:F290 [uncultured bacterium]
MSSADPLLRQADHARYEARQRGKNRLYVRDSAVTQQQARDTAVHRPARAAAP